MALLYIFKYFFGQIFERLTNIKVVRVITILTVSIYFISFLSSYFITTFFGYNGYSPITNMISDMGSIQYSPTPFLFDLACISAGILTFPITFFLYRYMKSKIGLNTRYKKLYLFLITILFISGIVGDIGFLGIGIFSIDRNPFNLHFIFAAFIFIGYYISTFLIGILTLKFKIKVNGIIGKSGMFISISIFFAFLVFRIIALDLIILEWIATLVLTTWLYIFLFTILYSRNYNK